jgi:hypothetical protein
MTFVPTLQSHTTDITQAGAYLQDAYTGGFSCRAISPEQERASLLKMIADGLSRADLLLVTMYYVERISCKDIATAAEHCEEEIDGLMLESKGMLHIVGDDGGKKYDDRALRQIMKLICYRLTEDEIGQQAAAVFYSFGDFAHMELRSEIARCRVARVYRDMNLCSPDEVLYLIAEPLRRLADRQVESEYDNPRSVLGQLGEAMASMEQAHQLAAGTFWRLDQAPPAYGALNAKWDERKRQITASVLQIFGEGELSDLLRKNSFEFERRFRNGKNRWGKALRQYRAIFS